MHLSFVLRHVMHLFVILVVVGGIEIPHIWHRSNQTKKRTEPAKILVVFHTAKDSGLNGTKSGSGGWQLIRVVVDVSAERGVDEYRCGRTGRRGT